MSDLAAFSDELQEIVDMCGFVAAEPIRISRWLTRVGSVIPPRLVDLNPVEVYAPRELALIEAVPECSKFAMPPRDAAAELQSLIIHSDKFEPVSKPADYQEAVLAIAEKTPRVAKPWWVSNNGAPATNVIMAAAESMNPDANAGYPYCITQLKKPEWAMCNKDLFMTAVIHRMILLTNFSKNKIAKMTPIERWRAGLCDMYRPIVKSEPTKIEKLEIGRQRLVVCGSTVDEAIDRLIFTRQLKALVKAIFKSYSALGIGFGTMTSDELIKVVMAHKPAEHSDMSFWEWTMQDFDYDAFTTDVLYSTDEVDEAYCRLVENRIECVKLGLYVTSDGIVYEQMVPGWNKSGQYITAGVNTKVRAQNSRWVGALWQLCAGDDCTESKVENAKERYQLLGKTLKDAKPVTDCFEFCSHEYHEDGSVEPLGIFKAAYAYVVKEPSFDRLMQFTYVYQQSKHFPRVIRALVRASKYLAPSQPGGEVNLQE